MRPESGPERGTPFATKRDRYTYPLRFAALTRWYDTVFGLLMPEEEMRRALLEGAAPAPGATVLDVGCGTGTVMIRLARRFPGVRMIGVDGDRTVLGLAEAKAREAGAQVEFRHGHAEALPFVDASVDLVISSMAFHHLVPRVKRAALREILRVLRPAGEFLLMDFGAPRGAVRRAAFRVLQVLDGIAGTEDHYRGRIPGLLAEAGFAGIREIWIRDLPFGTIHMWDAARPVSPSGSPAVV